MEVIRKYLNEKIYKVILDKVDVSKICEIRLRINQPIIINTESGEIVIYEYIVDESDIKEIFNNVTEYSAYAYEYSIKNGYITLLGGHRVGFGGEAIYENNKIEKLKYIRYMNFRISHNLVDCGRNVAKKIRYLQGIQDTLIISPPGKGKTSLLRDLVRIFSDEIPGIHICVIDERNEISASYRGNPSIYLGMRTDVICNIKKSEGIIMAIRSLAPKIIAVDEIGCDEDMIALKIAKQSGVSIIATIHGNEVMDANNKLNGDMDKLFKRKVVIVKKGEYICY